MIVVDVGRDDDRKGGRGKSDNRDKSFKPKGDGSQSSQSGKAGGHGVKRPRPAGSKPSGGGKSGDAAKAFRKFR